MIIKEHLNIILTSSFVSLTEERFGERQNILLIVTWCVGGQRREYSRKGFRMSEQFIVPTSVTF